MSESAAAKKSKAARINWLSGEHHLKMKQAVHDWLNQTKAVHDGNGELISDWKIYANKVGMPPSTFFHYIHPNLEKEADAERG